MDKTQTEQPADEKNWIPLDVYDALDDNLHFKDGSEPEVEEAAGQDEELTAEAESVDMSKVESLSEKDSEDAETTDETEAETEPEAPEETDQETPEQDEGQPSSDETEGDETNTKSLTDIELSDDEELVFEDEEGNEVPVNQIIEDWRNNQDWKKSNTEKAQELSEQRKELEEVLDKFGAKEVSEALQNEELQEALDDWFEGKDKNPFRNAPDVETYSEEQQQMLEEKVRLEIEKELFELQKQDETLKEVDARDALIQHAAELGVRIPVAYRHLKHGELSEQVGNLSKELKARNRELSKLKKAAGIKPESKTATGKGARSEGYAKPSASWEEARSRANKAWDEASV